jgi:outer membrane protein assembly factor BamA
LYNSVGDLRFSSIEYDDYGLGSSTTIDSVAFLDYNNSKLHLQLSRLIYRYLYAGLGYNFDFYYDQSETGRPNQDSDYDRYPYGTENSTVSSGLTFNILRDSRKNSINADGGFYSNLSYRVFNPALGSTYSWTAAFIDLRKYVALPTARRNIAAVRFLYWDTWGDVPYFDLPATFTDREFRMGRGYAYGRFRGNGLLYGELEYRFDLSRTGFWGGVVFANLQSYKEPESNTFVYANPAAGFGLRVKFNKRSNTNLTFDVAFGQNSWGWYLNLGEFF